MRLNRLGPKNLPLTLLPAKNILIFVDNNHRMILLSLYHIHAFKSNIAYLLLSTIVSRSLLK